MLASLFQGAQGLFVWTLDWLNFGARDPMGQESLTMVEASALHLTDVSQVQPTPKGSFEQVDRATVLDEITAWANEAPAPTLNPAETDLIAAAAWLDQDAGSDADLIVQFALHDANGLTYDALLATAQAGLHATAAQDGPDVSRSARCRAERSVLRRAFGHAHGYGRHVAGGGQVC